MTSLASLASLVLLAALNLDSPMVRAHLLGAVLAGAGLYLLLPPGGTKRRYAGSVLGVLSVGFFAAGLTPPGSFSITMVFWILAATSIVSAVASITSRNPVYCALWFGLTLLGTAGLFLLTGAQFLAVATMVVYAGAILVTFLFVLMLATPTGYSVPDRLSWEPLTSAVLGAILAAILTITLTGVQPGPATNDVVLRQNILNNQHMAHLGAQLFSRHLVAVELAGALLTVAIVGATAIVAHSKPEEPAKKTA